MQRLALEKSPVKIFLSFSGILRLTPPLPQRRGNLGNISLTPGILIDSYTQFSGLSASIHHQGCPSGREEMLPKPSKALELQRAFSQGLERSQVKS
jgi:hypothetical protein